MIQALLFGEEFLSTVNYNAVGKRDGKRDLCVEIEQLEDTALLQLISRGEDAALAELYDRYGRLVFSIAYRIIGHPQSAEDITLEVFTRAWEKGNTYDPAKGKVSTWLTRLARNRAIDQLRHTAIRPENESVGWSDMTAVPVTHSHNPEVQVVLNLQQEKVREAVSSLPDNQQEVLALAFFQGMTHSEIATHLNEPLGTVKGRIRAAMKSLRLMLADV
jgi:RNA polymerase sigma-70 factor (ECF subfamily)